MDVELKHIHKFFGTVHANNDVSIKFREGTIHGILGENGAGKSTLMKILAGYIPRSSGEIIVNGSSVSYNSPTEALKYRIGMLYQEPLDCASLSVLENFILGLPDVPLIHSTEYFRRILEDLSRQFGFFIDPDRCIEDLTVGERQQLEILRLVAAGASLIILDEPTTGISVTQKNQLFGALKLLADEGRIIVIVSHKLEDVISLCDVITVLRRGKVAGERRAPFDHNDLLKLMFEEIPEPVPRCSLSKGAPILWMDRIFVSEGRYRLTECSFRIREGEIVGLAGLEGSGQETFLRVASGLICPYRGKVYLSNEELTGMGRQYFKKKGIYFLPTDRLAEGLFPDLSIGEHFALTKFEDNFFIPWNSVNNVSLDGIKRFGIKGKAYSKASTLSGGNQQRLLLSLLPDSPRVLLLENPIRGLDIESSSWVWNYLQSFCSKGTAIVFSSSDLDEIFSVAHRVVVFFDGRIVLDASLDDVSLEEVQQAIAGVI